MKSKPDIDSLVTLEETADLRVVYDPDCDPFAVVDGMPNYFIINKKTEKVEFVNNREAFVLDILHKMQVVKDEGLEELPSLIPDNQRLN